MGTRLRAELKKKWQRVLRSHETVLPFVSVSDDYNDHEPPSRKGEMMTREQTNYAVKAEEDARECAEHFEGTLCEMWREGRKLSTDLLNDYPDGDAYHHENHTDKSYSLSEAAEVLERLSEFEETDDGLWEGLAPREAISAQAAYTYANAVYSEFRDLIEGLQSDLDELESNVEVPHEPEEGDAEEDDQEERVSVAGERFIRLFFALVGMDDGDHGGMVGAARRAAKEGEFTAALALADAVQESDAKYGEFKARAIRAAVQ